MRRDWDAIISIGAAYVRNETASYGVAPTLRRLHYLLVSDERAVDAGYVNEQTCYSQLSDKTARARDAGTFPSLTDRTRSVSWARGYSSPAQLLRGVARAYTLDRAELMHHRVVILVEKDGVVPLVESKFDWLDVAAVRGYPSVSFLGTLNSLQDDDRPTTAIYLGDFDPSGLDISRLLSEKLTYPLKRIALSREQIEEFELPPLIAKKTDSRTAAMAVRHGESMQVELDAMPADVLLPLISEAINEVSGVAIRDDGMPDWPEADASEAEDRARLLALAEEWSA